MGFSEEKEESVTLAEVKMLRQEMDVVKKGLKQTTRTDEKLRTAIAQIEKETKTLKEKVGAIEKVTKAPEEKVEAAIQEVTKALEEKVGAIKQDGKRVANKIQDVMKKNVGEVEALKEKVGAIEEVTKALEEKVGAAIEEVTKVLEEKVGAIKQDGKRVAKKIQDLMKKNVGEVEEETKTLKEKVGAIEEGTKTLKKNVGAIEEETKALEEKVGAIKQEGKQFAKQIQVLHVDALTAQYNSFSDRKAKFDHEWDEKLRTFFAGFFFESLFVASCSWIQYSADPSKFHGWIMTLNVAMSLIFLALSINLLICIYDFISQAKNLKTEKKELESDFLKVKERNGDTEAGPLDDEHAAKMAQRKADCLKETPVRVMPLLGVAVVIVVATVLWFTGQLIFVGKFFKLF